MTNLTNGQRAELHGVFQRLIRHSNPLVRKYTQRAIRGKTPTRQKIRSLIQIIDNKNSSADAIKEALDDLIEIYRNNL